METKDWLLFAGPIIGLIIGGAVASLVKWTEFRRQSAREERNLLKNGPQELHLEIHQFMAACDRFYTRVVRLTDLRVKVADMYEAFEELRAIINEPLPRLKSMQQRYAAEYVESWVAVLNATAVFEHSVESVFKKEKTFGDFRKLNNSVQQKCQSFLFRINEKLEEI